MYVTLEPCRLSGRRVPKGTILPEGFRVPSYLVSAGRIAYLPDQLIRYEDLDTGTQTEAEPAEVEDVPVQPHGEDESEPESDEDTSTDEDDESELTDEDLEVLIKQYETGNGWYDINGESVRGKRAAKRALRGEQYQ